MISRRSVVGSAWAVPVILSAAAAPASAASNAPPVIVTNVCQDGRLTFSSDRKNTRTDHLTIFNHLDVEVRLGAHVLTSAQITTTAVATTGTPGSAAHGFIVGDLPNKVSGVLTIAPRGWLDVQVRTVKPDAEAHLYLDCGREFIIKSVQP